MRLAREEKQNSFAFDRVRQERVAGDVFEEVTRTRASGWWKISCWCSPTVRPARKTWTIQESRTKTKSPIPRSVEQIVESAEKLRTDGWEWTLTGQFLEITTEVGIFQPRKRPEGESDVRHQDRLERKKSVTNLRRVKLDTAEQVTELIISE